MRQMLKLGLVGSWIFFSQGRFWIIWLVSTGLATIVVATTGNVSTKKLIESAIVFYGLLTLITLVPLWMTIGALIRQAWENASHRNTRPL